jgi:hypothetical protein
VVPAAWSAGRDCARGEVNSSPPDLAAPPSPQTDFLCYLILNQIWPSRPLKKLAIVKGIRPVCQEVHRPGEVVVVDWGQLGVIPHP